MFTIMIIEDNELIRNEIHNLLDLNKYFHRKRVPTQSWSVPFFIPILQFHDHTALHLHPRCSFSD